jgi:hypothetical protein
MGIAVKWDNENPTQTTIHLQFEPDWNWVELHEAIEIADSMIVSVKQTVNLIIDIRDAGGIPHDFMQAAGEIFAGGNAQPNEGRRVVVGAGRLIQMAYNGLARVYSQQLANRQFLFAANLAEARTLLK